MTQASTHYTAIMGGLFKHLRELLDWEQRELAKACELSQATMSRIERGEAPIYIHHLVIIAEAFGYLPSEIAKMVDDIERYARTQGVKVYSYRPERYGKESFTLISRKSLQKLIEQGLNHDQKDTVS